MGSTGEGDEKIFYSPPPLVDFMSYLLRPNGGRGRSDETIVEHNPSPVDMSQCEDLIWSKIRSLTRL